MCLKPLTKKINEKVLNLPCSLCVECKAVRVKEWAFRINQEKKKCENVYFATLTYAEENLTWGEEEPTLIKRDAQLFLKRLRKLENGSKKGKIKYYLAGEYGTTFKRPHYHAIIFGCPLKEIIGEQYAIVAKAKKALVLLCILQSDFYLRSYNLYLLMVLYHYYM